MRSASSRRCAAIPGWASRWLGGSPPAPTAVRFTASARWVASTDWPSSSRAGTSTRSGSRSEEHTSELQSRENLVCRLLLEKQNSAKHAGLRHRHRRAILLFQNASAELARHNVTAARTSNNPSVGGCTHIYHH